MSREALDKLQQQLGDAVLSTHDHRGDETAVVAPGALWDAARWLRDELKFNMLSDMTAADYLPREPRFEVVYHLLAVATGKRLRLKVQLPADAPMVDSICELYPIADWLEREIWDMYGIRFADHPDLKRILLYEEFIGHPLRKDYPKEKRQPLVRRPENEILEAMERKGKGRYVMPNYDVGRTGDDS